MPRLLIPCLSLGDTGSSSEHGPRRRFADLVSAYLAREAGGLHDLTVLLPKEAEGLLPAGPTYAYYEGPLLFEKSFELWSAWSAGFDHIVVYGTTPSLDGDAILIALYIQARRKTFLSADGRSTSLARWHDDAYLEPKKRPVRLRRVTPEISERFGKAVNRWACELLRHNDYAMFRNISTRGERLGSYEKELTLGMDLRMQTPDLHHDERFGVSWSHFMTPEGALVHSPDYHRAVVNFIDAIDGIGGIHSVLDVGTGSGLVPFFLSANPRYSRLVGVDGSYARCLGARLHASLHGLHIDYQQMDMAQLQFPDASFDVTVTCAALEQTAEFLPQALGEILRVTRRYAVLVEPSIEYFQSVPGQITLLHHGWARGYTDLLLKSGKAYAVRPHLLSHYYNPVTLYVIDMQERSFLPARFPHLFQLGTEQWPGGVEYEPQLGDPMAAL